jgi:hypothetical protein
MRRDRGFVAANQAQRQCGDERVARAGRVEHDQGVRAGRPGGERGGRWLLKPHDDGTRVAQPRSASRR